MRRTSGLLVIALLIGALGATMVYRYLASQQAELDAARAAVLGALVEIAIADGEIPVGTRIEAGQVRMVKWPQDSAPETAIRDVSQVLGKTSRVSIRRYQPLVESDVTTDFVGVLPLLIEPGMRAMSVRVDRVSGVSGFVTPSSHVDVLIAGVVEGEGDRVSRSKMILQGVEVIATGTEIEQGEERSVEVPTVTLLLEPADAEKLTLATKDGALVTLALRNFSDEEHVATPGATYNALLGVDDGPRRSEPAAAPAIRPVAATRPSIEVVLGEEITRQSY